MEDKSSASVRSINSRDTELKRFIQQIQKYVPNTLQKLEQNQ